MANHGYSPEDWLDVANMTASVLLEFMPNGKWSLGICQGEVIVDDVVSTVALTNQLVSHCCDHWYMETTPHNMSQTSAVSVFFCHVV